MIRGVKDRKEKERNMSDENIKNNDQLNLDDLDEVAGGYVFATDDKYQVIDD